MKEREREREREERERKERIQLNNDLESFPFFDPFNEGKEQRFESSSKKIVSLSFILSLSLSLCYSLVSFKRE